MPKYIVSIELKEQKDIPKKEFADHIRTAVGHWGGGGHPDEPFFPDNIKKVTVTPLTPMTILNYD